MLNKLFHNRWRVAVVMLLSLTLLSLNTSGLFAQEETQESAVESVEPTVTEAPTEIPTEAPTEPPAPTEIIEPTATEAEVTPTDVVSEATEEATQEATAPAETTEEIPVTEVTPTEAAPTLQPEPGLMLVYNDTFAGGQTTVWTLGANWATITSEADFALKAGDSLTELWLYENLFDAAVQARVLLTKDAASLTMRRGVTEGYTAELNRDGSVKLLRAGSEIASASLEVADGWHTLRLSTMGGILRVSVDGVEVIAVEDDAPLPPGKVYLSASSTSTLFDDFQVWSPDNQPPPMIATPPTPLPTAEATAELTPEVTSLLPNVSGIQAAMTFVVNTKSDNPTTVDACDATHCTLRDAITAANANVGFTDSIEFNIPAESAPFAIGVFSCQLPTITDPVIIDGYTQPNAVEATSSTPAILKIELVGTTAQGLGGCPTIPDGLRIMNGGSGSIIRGLSITNFKGNGIQILGAHDVVIAGNFIGLEVGGSQVASNLGDGVLIDGEYNAQNPPTLVNASNNNIIGGMTPADRNVISANSGDGVEVRRRSMGFNYIIGNYIGTDKGGTTDRGNGANGVNITGNGDGVASGETKTVVGGPGSQYRNVISGNASDGVEIRGDGANFSVVQGNYIGLNAAGNQRVPNDADGIYVVDSGGNLIGGIDGITLGASCTGACNVITGNGSDGIEIAQSTIGITGNQIWGNFIGLNPSGTSVVTTNSITGNAASGIRVNNVAGVVIGVGEGAYSDELIPQKRNIISGNQGSGSSNTYGIIVTGGSLNTEINGNYIGTNSAGTAAVPNKTAGVMIQSQFVYVGGLTLNTQFRNVISGNTDVGIEVSGVANRASRIRGNFIGTDATGTAAIPNGDGIRINGAVNNFIGDIDSALSRNVISGNAGDGVEITGATAEGNRVQLNLIGVDASGANPLPNQGNGVLITNSAKRNQIGYDIDDNPNSQIGSNDIANNTLAGVAIETTAGTGNTVMNNAIYNNGGLGIDLGTTGANVNDADDADTGPNNLQNFPVLTNVTRTPGVNVAIQATLDGTPNTLYRIDFFANTTCDVSGYGEGADYLASLDQVAADANGTALISINIPDSAFSGAAFFTMTATDYNDVGGFPEFNTSEFSRCIDRSNNPPTISDIADQTTRGNNPVSVSNIVVNDVETAVGSLTMSAISSDTTVIPNENITFGGSGSTRTMNFFAVNGLTTAKTVTIRVRVTDAGGAFGEDVFVVNISADAAPTFVSPGLTDKTTAFMAPITVNFTVADTDDDLNSLVLSVQSSSNLGLVPLGNIVFGGAGASRSMTITPAAGQTGNSDIIIRLSDGDRFTDDPFKLTVSANGAPVIGPATINPINAYSNLPRVANFTVTDSTPTGTLTVTGISDNQAILPDANIVTAQGAGTAWTVTILPGNVVTTTAVKITLTASDGFGQGTKQIQFNVAPNVAPAIGAITSPQVTSAGVPKSVNFTVTDATSTSTDVIILSATSSDQSVVDNDDISFTVGSGSNRTITMVPVAFVASAKTTQITITASDGNLASTRQFDLRVDPNSNTPPTISNITDQSTMQNTPVGPLAFTVGDSGTGATPVGSLLVSGTSSNTTLVPNANIVFGGSGASRTVTVTPAAAQTGQATITVTVTDGGGAIAQDTFILTVAGNTAPTISTIPNRTTPIDTPVGPIPFTIGDGQTAPGALTVTAESLSLAIVSNAGLTLGGSDANRTITVTPLTDAVGQATIRVNVSDGDLTTQATFVVTVNANVPPVISDIPNRFTTISTQTGPLPFTIGDVETPVNSLNVSATSSNTTVVPNSPSNIVLGGSGANRTINLIPVAGLEGTSTITVTVTDGKNATATDIFVLTIAENIPPTISVIADQTIAPNSSLGPIIFSVSDAETALSELVVEATSSNQTLVPNANIFIGGSGSERTLILFPANGQSGQTTITITVTDGANITAERQFQLLVQLAAPIPDVPANLSNQTSLKPAFKWSKVNGAASYSIQLDNLNDPQNPVTVFTQTVTNNSFTPASELPQGYYAWRVKALNSGGGGLTDWSVMPNFTISILKSPANGSFVTDAKPNFTWTAVKGATFELQIDEDNTFPGPLAFSCPTTKTSCKPTTDLALGTYYWRVNINGVASAVYWQVTVSPALLTPPVHVSPAAGAFINDATPLLTWNSVVSASGYEVQVDDQSKFTSPEFIETGITGGGATVSTDVDVELADKVFYWRVRTYNSFGAPGAWSKATSFTVDTQAQGVPELRSPVDDAQTNDTTPAFSWGSASGASGYVLDVARDEAFTNPVAGLDDLPVTKTSFVVPANLALPNGTYYWRVWSVDKAGNESEPSDPPFTLVVNILKSPANGAFTTDQTPTFSWSSVTAGTTYQIEITSDTDTNFASPRTITGCGTNGTTTAVNCTPTNSLPHGRYIWRVNINGVDAELYWLLIVSPTPPGVPTPLLPANNASVNDNTPTLSWTAPNPTTATPYTYEVQVSNNNKFTNLLFAPASGSATFRTVTTPLADGKYFWRVRTLNTYGAPGNWSKVQTLTVDTVAPTVPVLSKPENNALLTTTTPQLSWKSVSGAKFYLIDIASNSTFTTLVIMNASTAKANYKVPNANALADGIYYRRVRAVDAAGNVSATSSVFVFRVDAP